MLRPKVDAAWHLHELTRELDLSAFVLFSSVAGALGGAGQGNYAAAQRLPGRPGPAPAGRGLPGVSLAWGAVGPGRRHDRQAGRGSDMARLARSGMPRAVGRAGPGSCSTPRVAGDRAVLLPLRTAGAEGPALTWSRPAARTGAADPPRGRSAVSAAGGRAERCARTLTRLPRRAWAERC